MIGFTERPSLDEFVELSKRRNIPTFEDLGSGCIADLTSVGLGDEPVAAESIRSGIDIISFSGDKLLGDLKRGSSGARNSMSKRSAKIRSFGRCASIS